MDKFDIQECLNNMVILVDTREQETDRAKKRYKSFGIPYHKVALPFGDYSYNYILPENKWFYDETDKVVPDIVIERKLNLAELSNCFTHERERFQREFERAKEAGAKVILLVENATWENLINGKYPTKYNPQAFLASITAYMVRYDMDVIFCKEETSGRLIKEILYRHLKEKLEKELNK